MYSAAVFLCVVYRVTSGFTVMASHNLRKSARRCSGCTIMIAAPSLGDLPRKCEQKIDVVNVITAPEIEMLIIHAEGAYDQFKRSEKNQANFVKQIFGCMM